MALAIAAACATALAACGEEEGSEAASTPGTADAKKELAPYLKLPAKIGPTEPLKAQPKGKTVTYLECSIVNCKDHSNSLKEAFGHLGVKLKIVNSGLSPETFKNAFETAKQETPDGVIYDAIPAAIAQKPAEELAADGVPVVAIASPDLKLGKGVYNIEGPGFYERMGATMANWSTVDSKGAAKVVYLKDPTLAFGKPETDGVMRAFDENCPKCKVDVLETSSSAAGTKLPPEVVGYLQKNPDTKYVVGQYSALLLGVPSALKSAGITGTKLVGFAPTEVNQEAMKAGQEAAGVMQSNEALPWTAADVMARALVDQPVSPKDASDPPIVQLVPSDGVDWDPGKEDWPYIPGWKQQFIGLWNGD